jgi:hypothetical protein
MERETCLVPYSIMKRDTKLPSLYVVGKRKLFAAAYNYTGFTMCSSSQNFFKEAFHICFRVATQQ